MIFLELFWSFFQIGLLSFGGGYAVLPLIQSQIVDVHGWMTAMEYADIITISQMLPGPIAITSANFVGLRMAGIPGAIVAVLSCILPCCIIVLTLAVLYAKFSSLDVIQGALGGLRPAVVSLIGSAGLSIIITAFWGTAGFSWATAIPGLNIAAVILFLIAFVVMRKWKFNPILVMLCCGGIGIVYYLITNTTL